MLLLHNINNANITYLDTKIKEFWDLNKSAILSNNANQFNEEDLKGKSFYQWSSMSYYYVLNLLLLIQIDKNHSQKEWSYYYEKYNITNIKKCLSCIGINLNKNLEIFGFPITEAGVIEQQNVQVVEQTPVETIDIEVIEVVDLEREELIGFNPNR